MINERRIREAIRVMEVVRDKALPFDMTYWFKESTSDCGTAACFGGWLCRDPYFQTRGLKGRNLLPVFNYDRMDGRIVGVHAIERALGIDYNTTEELTLVDRYPPNATPQMVIDKLELLLIGKLEIQVPAEDISSGR